MKKKFIIFMAVCIFTLSGCAVQDNEIPSNSACTESEILATTRYDV